MLAGQPGHGGIFTTKETVMTTIGNDTAPAPAGTPGVRRRSVLKWVGIGVGSVVLAGGAGVGVRGRAVAAVSA